MEEIGALLKLKTAAEDVASVVENADEEFKKSVCRIESALVKAKFENPSFMCGSTKARWEGDRRDIFHSQLDDTADAIESMLKLHDVYQDAGVDIEAVLTEIQIDHCLIPAYETSEARSLHCRAARKIANRILYFALRKTKDQIEAVIEQLEQLRKIPGYCGPEFNPVIRFDLGAKSVAKGDVRPLDLRLFFRPEHCDQKPTLQRNLLFFYLNKSRNKVGGPRAIEQYWADISTEDRQRICPSDGSEVTADVAKEGIKESRKLAAKEGIKESRKLAANAFQEC